MQAATLLTDEERARAARFVFAKDRVPWMAARAVLRLLMAHYTGLTPQELSLAVEAQGKPFLPGSELRFNLSHTDGIALFAFAHNVALGVDVERVSAASRVPLAELAEVARQNFSPGEQRALAQLAPGDQLAGFYRCWTRKEALLKAEGSGLLRALDSFAVSLAPGAPARVLAGAPGWSLAHLDAECEAGQVTAVGAMAWAEQPVTPAIDLLEWIPSLFRI